MKFPRFSYPPTGTAVPVSAIHSESSLGIGEFLDLIPFGGWCKKCSLDVIQILPVNDTGYQESPYSALSAFALNPVYLRISEVPGAQEYEGEIQGFSRNRQAAERVDYQGVREFKLSILRKIYADRKEYLITDPHFLSWLEDNRWVRTYAVYSSLREKNERRHWKEWERFSDPKQKDIETYWDEELEATRFYAWVQFILERQLKQASDTLASIGVALKGDIPILMQEDSADVWAHRKYFDLSLRAGAPPDMYSYEGQNWGFPIYNWDRLRKDGFSWWKSRLLHAERFYNAFRIDHVLGFFRIWAIPAYEHAGSLGYYLPAARITRDELEELGFGEQRITWLSRAHIYTDEIRNRLDDKADEALTCLRRIGQEELFIFDSKIRGSSDIDALDISDTTKEALKEWKRNRTLIEVEKDTYAPAWHFAETRAYHTLSDGERSKLHDLIDKKGRESETIWENHATELLSMIRETTDMLVCAEDLGVVPQAVPRVLKNLGILSLKILFWTKEYGKPGEPFMPVSLYPFLSVATLSVHDSQVFGDWWENDSSEEERKDLCRALGIAPLHAQSYGRETARSLLEGLFSTYSYLCILQVQELLLLGGEKQPPFREQRINIPGTVDEKNWSYRMPQSIEECMRDDLLSSTIRALASKRRERSLTRLQEDEIYR
jgi:4-alpha-glucanotransferase